MRTLGTAFGALIILSGIAMADEASPVAGQAVAAPIEGAIEVSYPLKWQRQLLAAQLAFAATLQKTDPIETGSVTPQAR